LLVMILCKPDPRLGAVLSPVNAQKM